MVQDGDTPMHMVAKNGSAQISQLLIAVSPDLELKNKVTKSSANQARLTGGVQRGWTAQKLATFNGHKGEAAAAQHRR